MGRLFGAFLLLPPTTPSGNPAAWAWDAAHADADHFMGARGWVNSFFFFRDGSPASMPACLPARRRTTERRGAFAGRSLDSVSHVIHGGVTGDVVSEPSPSFDPHAATLSAIGTAGTSQSVVNRRYPPSQALRQKNASKLDRPGAWGTHAVPWDNSNRAVHSGGTHLRWRGCER